MPDPFVGPLQQFNYPAGPVTPPNLTGGSASDALRALLGYGANRTAAADSQATDMFAGRGLAGGAYANAIGNQNTATGLSPEALAALRTQGTSGINDQYQSAAQALNSQLLRHGATGNQQLPGYGGDISRAYQPLYSAMEAAKSKAQQDTILADEAAKQKSLYQNQQLALQAAQGLNSGATSLFNAGTGALGQSGGIAQALASLEGPDIWKLLGTQGLTSLLTQTGLAGKGVDEIKKLLGFGGDAITSPMTGVNAVLNGANPNTSIPSGSAASLPGSAIQPLPSGVGPQAAEIGAPAAGAAGIAGLSPEALAWAGLEAPAGAAAASLAGAIPAGVLGAVPGATGASAGLAALAPAALPEGFGAPAAVAGSTASTGGLGASMMALATNPITWAAAGVIGAAILWHKSQSHQTADTWTRGYQGKFDQDMANVSDEFAKLKQEGAVTPEVAQQFRDSAQQLIDAYQGNLSKFYSQGKKEAKVATQAQNTAVQYYGPMYENFLGNFTA